MQTVEMLGEGQGRLRGATWRKKDGLANSPAGNKRRTPVPEAGTITGIPEGGGSSWAKSRAWHRHWMGERHAADRETVPCAEGQRICGVTKGWRVGSWLSDARQNSGFI